MDENEKDWAGTWIERPQSISLCNRCVFVGWRHLKHTPSPCVKMKTENHEPLKNKSAPKYRVEVLHLFRWSTHTHASLPRGCFGNWGPDNEMKMKKKGNENEVKMTMRWKLLNQDAKRGTQKKRERANTNTWNLAQNGQPWKGKGKEKRRPTENGTRPAEEGEDRSAWTNLTRRKPTTTSARNGPNLPGERRTQEHMKKEEKGTYGELVHDMMHPHERAEIPSLGSTAWVHANPIDGCQCSNELRAQLNLTEKPKGSDHTCKACPVAWSSMSKWLRAVSWSNREVVVVASNYASLRKGKGGPVQRPVVQHSLDRLVKLWKKAICLTLLRRITNSKV